MEGSSGAGAVSGADGAIFGRLSSDAASRCGGVARAAPLRCRTLAWGAGLSTGGGVTGSSESHERTQPQQRAQERQNRQLRRALPHCPCDAFDTPLCATNAQNP